MNWTGGSGIAAGKRDAVDSRAPFIASPERLDRKIAPHFSAFRDGRPGETTRRVSSLNTS
jgi:hypothetical protein